jgi:hypothetical protein
MNIAIHIPGTEDEAGPELKGVLPEAVLAVTGLFGSPASYIVIATQEMV